MTYARQIPILLSTTLMVCGCSGEQDRQRAMSQVTTWVDRLDAQTTESGVYIRHQGETLPETDPWGRKLRVSYSRGGMAEIVKVRSAGPDGSFGNDDDILEERQTMNLAGLGEGMKTGIQETASEAAKGAVKGAVEGFKESLPKFGRNPAKPEDAIANQDE